MITTTRIRGAKAPLPPTYGLLATVAFFTFGASAGCRDADVIAKVGSTELRRADLDEFKAQRAAGADDETAQLETLIGRERLAEHAVSRELERRPDVRARIAAGRREILAQVLMQESLRDVADEAALRARFEASKEALVRRQVHVRQIMVRFSVNADASERRRAMNRATAAYARILEGASFEEVARDASQDEVSAARGGDLGIVREGQVHPSFFEVAAALKKDEVSKPFETPYGIHVIQALAPMERVVPVFEEVRGRLSAEARSEAELRLMKELEAAIPVKRFPEAMVPPASDGRGPDAQDGEGPR